MGSPALNEVSNLHDEGSTVDGDSGIPRRDFVQSVAVAGVAVGIGAESWAAETKSGEMIYRTLGRTGEKVSAIGLGGFHIGIPENQQESIRLIRTAIDRGITFMD